MKIIRSVVLMLSVSLAALAACEIEALRAAANTRQQAATSVKATAADFAWMAGRWTGSVGKNPIEYECSEPRLGHMMCMFRVLDDKNVLGLEFVSLEDTTEGLKEHIRFYSPSLSADGPDAVTMELESIAPDRIVFVNPNGTRPKRTTTLRNGDNAFTSHIEMIDARGKPSAMDAHWVRAK